MLQNISKRKTDVFKKLSKYTVGRIKNNTKILLLVIHWIKKPKMIGLTDLRKVY